MEESMAGAALLTMSSCFFCGMRSTFDDVRGDSSQTWRGQNRTRGAFLVATGVTTGARDCAGMIATPDMHFILNDCYFFGGKETYASVASRDVKCRSVRRSRQHMLLLPEMYSLEVWADAAGRACKHVRGKVRDYHDMVRLFVGCSPPTHFVKRIVSDTKKNLSCFALEQTTICVVTYCRLVGTAQSVGARRPPVGLSSENDRFRSRVGMLSQSFSCQLT